MSCRKHHFIQSRLVLPTGTKTRWIYHGHGYTQAAVRDAALRKLEAEREKRPHMEFRPFDRK